MLRTNRRIELHQKLFIVALLLLSIGFPKKAEALPAFARKYETSCNTCHVAFPKLNAFGEAYRIAGYQIPEGDERFIKQEPVSLGSEAWKRVWPEAIWPAAIAPSVPLAVRVTGAWVDDLRQGKNSMGENQDPLNDFRFPTALNLYGAGTLSEDMSLYVADHLYLNGANGELGKTFVQFSNLLDNIVPRQLFNLRTGLFVPASMAFDHHRNIMFSTPMMVTANTVTGTSFGAGHVHLGGHSGMDMHGSEPTYSGAFAMGQTQIGAELFGLVGSRMEYTLGVVNGAGNSSTTAARGTSDNNNSKDVYVRFRKKFGGMGFDGAIEKPNTPLSEQNDKPVLRDQQAWVDNSIVVGGFYYSGSHRMQADWNEEITLYDSTGNPILTGPNTFATLDEAHTENYTNKVWRSGADIDINQGNFDLIAAGVIGEDSNPLNKSRSITISMGMAQLDWVSPWPWVILSERLEEVRFDSDLVDEPADTRGSVSGITMQLRSNVKAQIEYQMDLDRAKDKIHNDMVVGVIDVAF